MASETKLPSLRERRRLDGMRAVQRHGMRLFEERGFDRTTVEQVADAAGVAPISVYRWFGTKERLVLWDDYDPDLFTAVAGRLTGQAPLPAVRDAVVAEVAVAILTVASDAWQQGDGEVDLAAHVTDAFGVLRGASWTR